MNAPATARHVLPVVKPRPVPAALIDGLKSRFDSQRNGGP